MSKLEETHKVLNEQLSTLGLESDQEGDGEMLSLTTHLAAKYPDLLDGDYEIRVKILNNLTKKSGEILERKSWRLAKMTPEKVELWRINSEKERKQLMIEMNPIADGKNSSSNWLTEWAGGVNIKRLDLLTMFSFLLVQQTITFQ